MIDQYEQLDFSVLNKQMYFNSLSLNDCQDDSLVILYLIIKPIE